MGAGEPVCFPFNCYICVPWTPASAAPGSRLRDLLGITSSPTPRFIPKGRETERSHSHDKVCVHSRSQGSTGLPRAPREHCRDSSRPVRSGHPRGGVCSPRPRSLVGPSAQGKRGAKSSRESGWWQGDAGTGSGTWANHISPPWSGERGHRDTNLNCVRPSCMPTAVPTTVHSPRPSPVPTAVLSGSLCQDSGRASKGAPRAPAPGSTSQPRTESEGSHGLLSGPH